MTLATRAVDTERGDKLVVRSGGIGAVLVTANGTAYLLTYREASNLGGALLEAAHPGPLPTSPRVPFRRRLAWAWATLVDSD